MVVWKAYLAALTGLITIACASSARRDDTAPNYEKTNVPGAYIVELADDQVLFMATSGAQLDLTPA